MRVCARAGVIRTPEHLPAAAQEVSNRLINTESDFKKKKKTATNSFKILNFALIS